ncbi:MAG: LptE family protein [Syntrophales bacterium]|nr:LptE family protein [Syntrophales bacterium]
MIWRILKTNFLTVIVAFFFLAAGCGYHFSPAGDHIDKRLETVFVDNFSNNTSEANVENYFRNSFIDQFRKGSRFKLVNSKNLADTVLKGSINSLVTPHLAYSASKLAKENRVTVTMEVVFEERETKKIIWANKNLSENEDYLVDESNPNTTETNRTTALKKLAEDTAEKTYRYIMSGF